MPDCWRLSQPSSLALVAVGTSRLGGCTHRGCADREWPATFSSRSGARRASAGRIETTADARNAEGGCAMAEGSDKVSGESAPSAQTYQSTEHSSALTPDELRSQIEATRAEMGQTIDAIQERLRPGHLVSEAKHAVQEATLGRLKGLARSVGTGAGEWSIPAVRQTMKDYPLPAALIGAASAGLLVVRYDVGDRLTRSAGMACASRERAEVMVWSGARHDWSRSPALASCAGRSGRRRSPNRSTHSPSAMTLPEERNGSAVSGRRAHTNSAPGCEADEQQARPLRMTNERRDQSRTPRCYPPDGHR